MKSEITEAWITICMILNDLEIWENSNFEILV